MRMLRSVAALTVLLLLSAVSFAQKCGCMDVALVVDDTGSMGPAISNIQVGLPNIIDVANTASGGDLRVGLVGLQYPITGADAVAVHQPFTTNLLDAENSINSLFAWGGFYLPEISDEALRYVV